LNNNWLNILLKKLVIAKEQWLESYEEDEEYKMGETNYA
jgi:hypothetical protein